MHDGLIVSVLDYGSSRPDINSWLGALRYVLRQDIYTFIVPLYIQVYKWVLANLELEVTLR